MKTSTQEMATLAGGCFWCTEAIFRRLNGVVSVMAGYSGGTTPNPTCEQVCSGNTGHAEAVQITFDPQIISYKTLLEIFFRLHDPTTLNQQGNDIGTHYRSVIFFHNTEQQKIAGEVIMALEKAKTNAERIVTDVIPYTTFYHAENSHQNYYEKNKQYSYCQYVIDPKISKLYKEFPEQVIQTATTIA